MEVVAKEPATNFTKTQVYQVKVESIEEFTFSIIFSGMSWLGKGLLEAGRRGKRTGKYLRNIGRQYLDFRPRVYIVVYHRVVPELGFNLYGTKITAAAFQRQLEQLAECYSVVSMEDIRAQYVRGKLTTRVQVVITFDDGYSDNYHCAFPLLEARKLPATFFAVTDYIGKGKPLWDYQLALALTKNEAVNVLDLPDLGVLQRGERESQHEWIFRVNEEMKKLDAETRDEAMRVVSAACGTENLQMDEVDCCMEWEQLAKMHEGGMEIGAHTCSHPSLARIDPGIARDEIRESKRAIEDNLGVKCPSFSFPFGSRLDFNRDLIDEVECSGFCDAHLNVSGFNRVDTSLFELKRIIATESTDFCREIG